MPLTLTLKARDVLAPDFTIEVPDSMIVGAFAIHAWHNARGATEDWTATHVASGACIGRYHSERIVRRLVKALQPLTVANETDPDSDKVFTDSRAAFDIVRAEREKLWQGL